MIARLLRRFWRDQTGTATVEFAILVPAVLMMFMSGMELGMISLQQAMLERAMDITVRDIRLSTGEAPQHDAIKDLLCERAAFITDCSANMRLEMVEMNPRAWTDFPERPDCTDKSEEVDPLTDFPNFVTNTRDNALMVLRACAKIDPLFPTAGLGRDLAKDGSGQVALVAVSVFVQEPR